MTTRRQQFKPSPKKRFAVGAEVRVKMPGVNGVVTHFDTAPTVMGEYWHTVRTEHGDRREPGSNLELVPVPAKNAKPKESLATVTDSKLLPPDQALSLLRTQLQEPVENLRHDDPDVDAWERVTLTVIERTFGEHSRNANHFATTVSYARQTDEETQTWHVENIKSKKGLLHSFIKELEVIKLSEIPVRVDGVVPNDPAFYKARLDAIWDVFGEDHILYGSDWPNSDHVATYDETLTIVRGYVAPKGQSVCEKFFWKNSIAAYKWHRRLPDQPAL